MISVTKSNNIYIYIFCIKCIKVVYIRHYRHVVVGLHCDEPWAMVVDDAETFCKESPLQAALNPKP